MSLTIIVLAGGKGTRIKSVLGGTPKLLAPVAKKEFLLWMIQWINGWKLKVDTKIVLSTCIGHEKIEDFVRKECLKIECINENVPVGTLKGAANVISKIQSNDYLILNGDTMFEIDMNSSYLNYMDSPEIPFIILKEVSNNDRYGGYKRVGNYWEPEDKNSTAISTGALFISRNEFIRRWKKRLPNIKFKINAIENYSSSNLMLDDDCIGIDPVRGQILGLNKSFIDIGIPSSLERAQKLIPLILSKHNDV